MGHSRVLPEVVEQGVRTGRWSVVIFDNPVTLFEDVVAMLMRSTGCSADEAFIETWEAQQYGKAPVHFAARTECEVVAAMISTIGVRTQVRPEWDD